MSNKALKKMKYKHHLEEIADIYSFFIEEEIDLILNTKKIDNYENPLKYIIEFENPSLYSILSDYRCLTISQTNTGFKKIKEKNEKYLNSRKQQLLSSDYSSISSLLGEIRAYGELLELFDNNIFIPTETSPTPDFRLIKKDYQGKEYQIDFEVYTRTIDKDSQKGVVINKSIHKTKDSKRRLEMQISTHSPFNNEIRCNHSTLHGSDLRHIIHLFTQIKAGDKQFDSKNINVLWIDMQDEIISRYDNLFSDSFPTKINNGSFISTVFWHAFYGKKGMTILHEFFAGEYQNFMTSKLEHDGRFYLTDNKTDFVVISFPNKKIIYEKPNLEKELPYKFRETLTHLLCFNSAESRIDVPKGSLQNLLAADYKNLEVLYEYLKQRDEEDD